MTLTRAGSRGLTQKFPLPLTKRYCIFVLACYFGASAISAYGQVHWAGWFFVGHSYSAWLIVSILAARRGTLKQSWLLCTGGLMLAVVTYYGTWSIVEPDLVGQFYLPTVVRWLFIAVPCGLLLSTIALWSYTSRTTSGVAVGIFIGMVWGDLVFSKLGLDTQAWINSGKDFTRLFSSSDALTWICVSFSVLYLLGACRRVRSLSLLWAIPVGVIAGGLLMGLGGATALLLLRYT